MLFGHRVHVHDESTYYPETCSISIKYIDICKLLHNILAALKLLFFVWMYRNSQLGWKFHLVVWGEREGCTGK